MHVRGDQVFKTELRSLTFFLLYNIQVCSLEKNDIHIFSLLLMRLLIKIRLKLKSDMHIQYFPVLQQTGSKCLAEIRIADYLDI